jgi:hypothetical protein
MTGKERLMRILEGKEADRPALKLWGLDINQPMLHPAYQPVYDLAVEKTDIMTDAYSSLDLLLGSENGQRVTEEDKPLPNSNWVDHHSYLKAGGRVLHSIHRYSTIGEPGYNLEHFVKEPRDLSAILTLDYLPYQVDTGSYYRKSAQMGDKGVVIFHIDHAAYAVQRIMGSETFALLCMDDRELLKEAIRTFSGRIERHVKSILDSGIRPIFGWVGPELCIPPLVRMKEFEEFVYDIDKPICDLIHNAGCHIWMHCHGRVGKLLERFMDMGIDVLNPIEPPPLGDVTLKQAVKIIGKGMGLEGNIEIQTLLMDSREVVREKIHTAAEEGKLSGRFILCPSAGYMEYVNPTPEYIDNLMLYINYGLECLE